MVNYFVRDGNALLPDMSRRRTFYVAEYQENIVAHDTVLPAIAA